GGVTKDVVGGGFVLVSRDQRGLHGEFDRFPAVTRQRESLRRVEGELGLLHGPASSHIEPHANEALRKRGRRHRYAHGQDRHLFLKALLELGGQNRRVHLPRVRPRRRAVPGRLAVLLGGLWGVHRPHGTPVIHVAAAAAVSFRENVERDGTPRF